MAALTGKAAF